MVCIAQDQKPRGRRPKKYCMMIKFFFFNISLTKASEMKPGYIQSCNAAINNPELNKSAMNDN